MKSKFLLFFLSILIFSCQQKVEKQKISPIKISKNQRFFSDADGKPFFWLGDTGWLLFIKLTREEAEKYFEDRKQKGFNVIQVMVIHNIGLAVNMYGDSAIINHDISKLWVTEGNDPTDSLQYDFWDHVDFVIDLAAKKELQMALVPVWGGNVRGGGVSREQAKIYSTFLAERYKDKPNIVWLNGGDTFGNDSTATWNIIGNTLNEIDTNHLITYHPRGRMQSSDWFHNEPWLDFNMVQSGHRRYDQDDTERGYGQDNYKYIQTDYNLNPIKPTIDGEPSYEGIPQGLHDTTQPYWNDNDVRRYAYWSVFAGACGYTYGHSAVMQFYWDTTIPPAYGAKEFWYEAINAPGASHMIHIKNLMLSRPYFERVPDQSLIANQGEKYNYQVSTRGNNYAFIYTYNGRNISVNMGKIEGGKVKASWFNPRNGEITEIGIFNNKDVAEFNPPGEVKEGNDWVLVLDSV